MTKSFWTVSSSSRLLHLLFVLSFIPVLFQKDRERMARKFVAKMKEKTDFKHVLSSLGGTLSQLAFFFFHKNTRKKQKISTQFFNLRNRSISNKTSIHNSSFIIFHLSHFISFPSSSTDQQQYSCLKIIFVHIFLSPVLDLCSISYFNRCLRFQTHKLDILLLISFILSHTL